MSAPPTAPMDLGSPQMLQLMKYMPVVLRLATQIPGILVGFIVTILYILLIVGSAKFQQTIAPIAGFHVIIFAVLRELFAPWQTGKMRARVLHQREAKRMSFNSDIAMQYRDKLD